MKPVYVKYFLWELCKDWRKQDSDFSSSSALLLKENWWTRNDRPIGLKYCLNDKTLIVGGSIKDAGIVEQLIYTHFGIDREIIHKQMQDVSRNKVKVKLILDNIDFYQCIENMRSIGINIQKVNSFGRLFR